MHCGLPLSLGLVLAACPVTDRATVNEVYYAATGDDTGSEFVELFNPTSHPVLLAGARLEEQQVMAIARLWELELSFGPDPRIQESVRRDI